jgi:hypothetical protein
MEIWFSCKHYFRRNPYWSWFKHLEELLNLKTQGKLHRIAARTQARTWQCGKEELGFDDYNPLKRWEELMRKHACEEMEFIEKTVLHTQKCYKYLSSRDAFKSSVGMVLELEVDEARSLLAPASNHKCQKDSLNN